MPNQLPKDATFKDMRSSSVDTVRFARRVLSVMKEAQREHGEIIARMGITGTGQLPNYRIEDSSGRAIVAINGANHQPWPDGTKFDSSENWSTAPMSYEDVQNVIASLTGYKSG